VLEPKNMPIADYKLGLGLGLFKQASIKSDKTNSAQPISILIDNISVSDCDNYRTANDNLCAFKGLC